MALGQQLGTGQQGFNIASQAGSEIGQQNWLGNMGYQQTGTGPGGVPLYTATTSLSPGQQSLYDQLLATQQQAGGQASNLLKTGNYGASSPFDAISGMAGGMTSGMLGNEVSYLNPFFKLQSDQEKAQLANQGFVPGSTAYNNAMMPLQTGQDLTVSNFLAQAYPQAFQMSAGAYQLPWQMAQGMAGFGAPQAPGGQFTQTPQLAQTNLVGATQTEQDALQAQYDAQLKQQQAMMGGLFGIGSAGVGALGQLGSANILSAALLA
jgi:hypothetical protein